MDTALGEHTDSHDQTDPYDAGPGDESALEGAPELSSPVSSVAEQLRRRRQELAQENPILLDVPGYDQLVARYHPIDYKLQRKILTKYERRSDRAEAEFLNAAENLVHACDDLLWREEGGRLRSLGQRWSAAFASEFMGIEGCQNGVQALAQMFPAPLDAQLVTHYGEFIEECKRFHPSIDEQLAGESPAGSATA